MDRKSAAPDFLVSPWAQGYRQFEAYFLFLKMFAIFMAVEGGGGYWKYLNNKMIINSIKGKFRGGISQNIYTSGFFRTQKFTRKVRESRQIQCYPKCAIRDKFNTKKVKKV